MPRLLCFLALQFRSQLVFLPPPLALSKLSLCTELCLSLLIRSSLRFAVLGPLLGKPFELLPKSLLPLLFSPAPFEQLFIDVRCDTWLLVVVRQPPIRCSIRLITRFALDPLWWFRSLLPITA